VDAWGMTETTSKNPFRYGKKHLITRLLLSGVRKDDVLRHINAENLDEKLVSPVTKRDVRETIYALREKGIIDDESHVVGQKTTENTEKNVVNDEQNGVEQQNVGFSPKPTPETSSDNHFKDVDNRLKALENYVKQASSEKAKAFLKSLPFLTAQVTER
jgi:hypothetical protein